MVIKYLKLRPNFEPGQIRSVTELQRGLLVTIHEGLSISVGVVLETPNPQTLSESTATFKVLVAFNLEGEKKAGKQTCLGHMYNLASNRQRLWHPANYLKSMDTVLKESQIEVLERTLERFTAYQPESADEMAMEHYLLPSRKLAGDKEMFSTFLVNSPNQPCITPPISLCAAGPLARFLNKREFVAMTESLKSQLPESTKKPKIDL